MYDYIVLDIEATKIPEFKPWHDNAYLCSVCIETPDKISKVWFFNPLLGDELTHLKEIQELVSNARTLVGHNIKYDLLWFQQYGIDFSTCYLYDTMVGEYLLHGQKSVGYSLNDVARRRKLGEKVDEMAVWWDNGFQTDEIPIDLHKTYVMQDVNLTHQIYLLQKEELVKYGLDKVADLTFKMTKVLTEVEFTGAPFDAKRAEDFCDKAEELVAEHESKMKELAEVDFEPSSAQQLAAVMFGGEWQIDGVEEYEVTLKSGIVKKKTRKCKVPIKYPGLGFVCDERDLSKKTGKPSTSSQVVDALPAKTKKQREFLNAVKSVRKLHKAVSSIRGKKGDAGWMAELADDGRIHSNFNQTVTVTGRLSSSSPNAQNLPRSKGTDFPLKKIFSPSGDKVILNIDLKQIEWRVGAELSRDAVMLDELNRGVDIHTENAKAIFGADPEKMSKEEFSVVRTASKTVSFRLLKYMGLHTVTYVE